MTFTHILWIKGGWGPADVEGLSELHFNVSLFSNRGEKVLKIRPKSVHSYLPFQDLLPGIGEQRYIEM